MEEESYILLCILILINFKDGGLQVYAVRYGVHHSQSLFNNSDVPLEKDNCYRS